MVGNVFPVFAIVLYFSIDASGDLINGRFPYYLMEELPPGLIFGQVSVDTGFLKTFNGVTSINITYVIRNSSYPGKDLFYLNESLSTIQTVVAIDREEVCKYTLHCYIDVDVRVYGTADGQTVDAILQIIVEIMDRNDQHPTFHSDSYVIKLSPNVSAGQLIALPLAEDADSPPFSTQNYTIDPENFLMRVEINRDTGTSAIYNVSLRIMTSFCLDKVLQIKLFATDGGQLGTRTATLINMVPSDIMSKPNSTSTIETPEVTFFVAESTRTGEKIGQINREPNVSISLDFSIQNVAAEFFFVNTQNGEIWLRKKLNYSEQEEYIFSFTRYNTDNANSSRHFVVVRVIDVNECTPQLSIKTLNGHNIAYVHQSSETLQLIAQVLVTDNDTDLFGLVNCSTNDHFFAAISTGRNQFEVRNTSPFPTSRTRFNVKLSCTDFGIPPLTSTAEIIVIVSKESIDTPIFSEERYTFTVLENTNASVLGQLRAFNLADGNSEIVYRLDGNTSNKFQVNSSTGVLTVSSPLDREGVANYYMAAYAYNFNDTSSYSSVQVVVTVGDTNDNFPYFANVRYAFGVFENEPAGFTVAQLTAFDVDEYPNNQIRYTVEVTTPSVPFAISPYTGMISTKQSLDRETTPVYYFSVVATNDRSDPPLSSSVSVTVYIADRNDHSPEITFPKPWETTVNIPEGLPTGSNVTQVLARDPDLADNGHLEYRIYNESTDNFFRINLANGVVTMSESVVGLVDDLYLIQIEVSDRGRDPGPLKSYADLTVRITRPKYSEAVSQLVPTYIIHVDDNATIFSCLAIAFLLFVSAVVLFTVVIYETCARTRSFQQKVSPMKTPSSIINFTYKPDYDIQKEVPLTTIDWPSNYL